MWDRKIGAYLVVFGGLTLQVATLASADTIKTELADEMDVSNPALVAQEPTWMQHENSAMLRPDALSDEGQRECNTNILDYVNSTFHTNFDEGNLAEIQLPNWSEPAKAFVKGGGYNVRIVGTQSRDDDSAPVIPLRTEPPIGYMELGLHPSLHIPGSIDGQQTYTARKHADGTTDLDFIVHIDSADPYVAPLGSLYHLFRDVIGASTRNPCPRSH
jgi:hypothetical protein